MANDLSLGHSSFLAASQPPWRDGLLSRPCRGQARSWLSAGTVAVHQGPGKVSTTERRDLPLRLGCPSSAGGPAVTLDGSPADGVARLVRPGANGQPEASGRERAA